MKTALLAIALVAMPGIALAHKAPIESKKMVSIPEAKMTITDTRTGRSLVIPNLTPKTCFKKAEAIEGDGVKANCRVEQTPRTQKPKPVTSRKPDCIKSPFKGEKKSG